MQSSKKRQRKKNHCSVIEQLATTARKIKCLYPKMTSQNDRQDRSLTGQVSDQAGHCPLTGRYLQPCSQTPRLIRADTEGVIESVRINGVSV